MDVIKTREQIVEELNRLTSVVELPCFFLANYFSNMRNDVDKAIVFKQIELNGEETKFKKECDAFKRTIDSKNKQVTLRSCKNSYIF